MKAVSLVGGSEAFLDDQARKGSSVLDVFHCFKKFPLSLLSCFDAAEGHVHKVVWATVVPVKMLFISLWTNT